MEDKNGEGSKDNFLSKLRNAAVGARRSRAHVEEILNPNRDQEIQSVVENQTGKVIDPVKRAT
jgi:hypothetical protein